MRSVNGVDNEDLGKTSSELNVLKAAEYRSCDSKRRGSSSQDEVQTHSIDIITGIGKFQIRPAAALVRKTCAYDPDLCINMASCQWGAGISCD